ncbi:acyl-CoA thioester hydrolase [Microvirga lupini]|uniref:Acyl-CoA thioester hydrolase n=2 Tax=Microvirga lupini TaxID=420324 RepID=A0A7W4YYG7_9HYPH|nr:acyl-CoA thioester hydrolase [Microvirga lupini]
MSEKRDANTSPLRGEVAPEAREGVSSATSPNVVVPPRPSLPADPPPQGEGGHYPHLSGFMQDGAHILPIRVYYEDTDFSARVYHASYLRFMERGRTELLRAVEVAQSDLHADMDGLAFVVRKMNIDFRGGAVMDDVLTIVTRPKEMRGASMTLAQEVRRGEEVLVAADVMVAAVRGGRAVRIPDELRAALSTP